MRRVTQRIEFPNDYLSVIIVDLGAPFLLLPSSQAVMECLLALASGESITFADISSGLTFIWISGLRNATTTGTETICSLKCGFDYSSTRVRRNLRRGLPGIALL